MGKKALIRVVQGTSVAIADGAGAEPSGELYQASRRALHLALVRAGGAIDRPGHGEACLADATDIALAVGIIACSLLADGYVIQLFPAGVPFDIQ